MDALRVVNGRLKLRDVVKADLPTLFRYQLDPESNRLVGFIPRTRPQFDAHWKKILADDGIAKKAIVQGRSMVGYIVCFERSGKRELGYWIDRAHWGRGIASRAVADFLKDYPVRPLFAVISKRNPASLKVAQKSGFVLVGEETSTNSAGLTTELFVLELGKERAGARKRRPLRKMKGRAT